MFKKKFQKFTMLLCIILTTSISACDNATYPHISISPQTDGTPIHKNQAGMEIRLTSIHDVHVRIAESQPPQVFVYIKGGLPDGCTSFHDIKVEHSGKNTVNIEVTVQRIKGAMCTQQYGYFEKNVNLGSDFISGQTYTINVNYSELRFVMP